MTDGVTDMEYKREELIALMREMANHTALCHIHHRLAEALADELEKSAPVVHGRWIECDYVEYDGHSECIHYPKAAWKCSNCCNAFKKELLWKDNYCPNCGARMDGE